MENMNCAEARHALWPPERPRLAEAEVLRARRHVQGCAACESYFEQDRTLLEAYDRASQERAPQMLRERVFDALARERARGFGSASPVDASAVGEAPSTVENPIRAWGPVSGNVSRRWVVAAAALVVGLMAGGAAVLFTTLPEPRSAGGLFAEDYLRRAVAEEKIVSSDAAEVGRFLTRELGRPIQPLRLAGLSLTSAEICLIEGRRGAMIMYVEGGREIFHYLIPREGTERREPEPAPAWGGNTGPGGPVLVTWATPEIEQALVGEVSEDHLMALARNASL